MSGFIPKEKLDAYQRWDMPDFDGSEEPLDLEDIGPSYAKVENSIIPKEKLTAYQRWELAAFDEAQKENPEQTPHGEVIVETVSISSLSDLNLHHSSQETPEESLEDAVSESPIEEAQENLQVAESEVASAVVLPTAAEIEQMHEEARQQGYDEGYKEGHAAGYETGAQEVTEKANRINAVMTDLETSLKEFDQQMAEKVLATAVELASQIVRQTLKIKPELVLPVVHEAMATLNPAGGHPSLIVHPDDAAIVREQLAEHLSHGNWRIFEDKSMEPGGCRVELGSGEVDATMQTRRKRILESMGISQEWLDERL